DLVAALESLAQGEVPGSPALVAALFRRVGTLAHERTRRGPLSRLTSREQEILALIDEGLSNKQIAGRLHIEIPTLRNHVHSILRKLGGHLRAQAAALLRSRPDRERLNWSARDTLRLAGSGQKELVRPHARLGDPD